MLERDRERARDREINRHTYRQKMTDRQRQRQGEREAERHIVRLKETETGIQKDKLRDRQTKRGELINLLLIQKGAQRC